MLSWILLGMAIVLEVAGTTCMKLSMGFTRWAPSVLIFVFYFLSFAALTVALKKIEVSTAYAIWSGVGTALMVFIGVLYFQETLNWAKSLSIVLIIMGVVGLHLSNTPS